MIVQGIGEKAEVDGIPEIIFLDAPDCPHARDLHAQTHDLDPDVGPGLNNDILLV